MVEQLAELFPGSTHVRSVGLKTADDPVVWSYAKQNGLAIVPKDADFHQRSLLLGYPPKIIWIRLGNCSTKDVEELLTYYANDVAPDVVYAQQVYGYGRATRSSR